MDNSSEKSSADIQREIDVDRQRIEARIGAIQERMSPGQLVDEVLAYARGSGGGEYVSNLGKALKANPLPVALMGVSLAWLMAKQGTATPAPVSLPYNDEYPLYSVQGSIRRVGPPEDVGGSRYSHFADDAGEQFKALTDETGRRAGNFLDASGNAYRGFADATGKQISQITDEAGTLLDASSGWASETWQQVKEAAGGVGQKMRGAASSMSGSASATPISLKDQSTRLNDAILTHFRDQPLVGGALAFAVGAAIGAALPHTDSEDELLGDAADHAKKEVAAQVSDLAEQSKDVASDAYDKLVAVASDVHDAAKDRIVEEVDQFKDRNFKP
jgi:ElaB/YqjD/DUF883 family membrane-anchored ribosome-binding protein